MNFWQKKCQAFFFLTKEGNNHILIFLLYFRQYMFLFVEKLMLLIRYVWNGKCYKTLPALNIISFCWIMVTWHFFLKKVYRLNDPIKYCLMFDRGNVEVRHKATLLSMASCWYFVFTPFFIFISKGQGAFTFWRFLPIPDYL